MTRLNKISFSSTDSIVLWILCIDLEETILFFLTISSQAFQLVVFQNVSIIFHEEDVPDIINSLFYRLILQNYWETLSLYLECATCFNYQVHYICLELPHSVIFLCWLVVTKVEVWVGRWCYFPYHPPIISVVPCCDVHIDNSCLRSFLC